MKVNRNEDIKVNSEKKCRERRLRSLCIARSKFIKSKSTQFAYLIKTA